MAQREGGPSFDLNCKAKSNDQDNLHQATDGGVDDAGKGLLIL